MKKCLIILAGICIVILGLATTAYAANQNFYFTLSDGGASAHSADTYKNDNEPNYYVTFKASLNGFVSTWDRKELLYLRARLVETPASPLYFISSANKYGTTYRYAYFSGAARGGLSSYRLYMSNPHGGNANPVSICGTWCP
jgi:hypothetical protein